MIWDGIRGIDYLASRPDIDSDRLGCTGNSGGGNMTSYIMALDPRVSVAAPSCFITTTRRKNESPGPGDVEQNIHGQIAFGMDHADYLLMRAPKPTLILSATRDFVPIEGAWESFRDAMRIYTRLGFPERVTIVETDQPHGFSARLREGSVRWMRRWLLGQDDAVFESDLAPVDISALQCTPDGQTLQIDGARSVFDLNRDLSKRLAKQRSNFLAKSTPEEVRRKIRLLADVLPLDALSTDTTDVQTELERDGYRIAKLILRPEPGIELPALKFLPDKPTGRTILYIHDDGKVVDAQAHGPIERLVNEGAIVLAVDLRGRGETATSPWRYGKATQYTGNDVAEFFIAYMLGKTFVGMRTNDIIASARYLGSSVPADRSEGIELIASGADCTAALHAAALEPQLFSTIELHRSLRSWTDVVNAGVTRGVLANCVHGSLQFYDLPDLVKLAGTDKVTIKSEVDATNTPIADRD